MSYPSKLDLFQHALGNERTDSQENPLPLGMGSMSRMLDLKTVDLTQSRFYQEVVALGLQQGLQQCLQQGLQEGLQQGLQEGRQEGRQKEAAELILRQLVRKCGVLTSSQVAQVKGLELEALEQLGEDLLDFTAVADLVVWLE